MTTGALLCEGDVTIVAGGAPSCSGTWSLMAVPAPFDPIMLDPQTMGMMFGFGFSLVMFAALLGHGGKAILGIFKD